MRDSGFGRPNDQTTKSQNGRITERGDGDGDGDVGRRVRTVLRSDEGGDGGREGGMR